MAAPATTLLPLRRPLPRVAKRCPTNHPQSLPRNSWLAGLVPLLATFTGATVAFLWPNLRGGFGFGDTEAEVRGFIEANTAHTST